MEVLQTKIDSDLLLKKNFINYYEESKENINFKTQLAFALLKSIKEDNDQFFSKGKKYYIKCSFLFIKFLVCLKIKK
jgi:hypothetical protein